MFGEYLVTKHLISENELQEALAVQPMSRKKIGRVLVELGFVTQEICDLALADFLNVKADENFLSYVSDKSAPFHAEMLEANGTKGFLVFNDPRKLYIKSFSDAVVERAEKYAESFEIYLITSEQWNLMESLSAPASPLATVISLEVELPKDQVVSLTPYGDLLISLLTKAKVMNASDVHFDSTLEGLSVRFRVNGDLTLIKTIKREHSQSFLTEVKSQTGLPLTVIGSACSGSARFPKLNLKVRAQSNGQIHGETIVLRLIDEERTKNASIDAIGADQVFEEDIRMALNFSNGLILMCGQTGSGKSWTLYSLLMSIDRLTSKVITIEDPVEYEGSGLMQIEVTDGKLSFQEALRSCLRLDPDVIMVGEIRDEETAELAFKAASTGHLVFSTLHTNGALEALARLKGLGIDDEMIESNVRLVSALTLKKRLCESCRILLTPDEVVEQSDDAGTMAYEGTQFYTRNIKGCDHAGCHEGATGRVLLYESISKEDIQNFSEGLVIPGFRSLKQCALEKAATGCIGLEEVSNG